MTRTRASNASNPSGKHGERVSGPEETGEDHDPLGHKVSDSLKLLEQPILGLIAAVALAFGFVGYRQYFKSVGEPSGWVDVLYADMQLVKLTSKVTKGDAPWTLDVGRLLAPIVTGYAAFRGVAALHRERLDRIRVQRWHGHVVVIGATTAAVAVAKSLRRQNRRVVLIDADLSPERAASLRSLGIFALKGEPARPEVLRQAAVRGATDVLALTDDDALNIDIALRSRSRTRAMASVSRPDLCELLRIEALGANGSARLDFLNADELGARAIERAFTGGRFDGDGTLLIAAPAALGAQLLARAARHRTDGLRHVHLTGEEANLAVSLARRRDPRALERLQVTVDATALEVEAIEQSTQLGNVKHAVISSTGTKGVALALAIARRLSPGAEVVLALPDPEHLVPLLHSGSATRAVHVRVVDSISWWTDSELVLGGTVEVIARATHANYVASRLASGIDATTDPALVEWARLSRTLKDSNRSQARHLWTKLAAANCALAPASGAGSDFRFTDAEVDRLAVLEHERWVKERVADGWTTGPRDVNAKRTPYLIDWSALPEDIRDLDRITVEQLPAFLADVGYEIVRNETTNTA